MLILKTKKLILREVSCNDADFILKLMNEPAWHEFIAHHTINTKQKAEKYIAHYKENNFGLWIVEKSVNSTPIGICGLLKRDSLDTIDLGFAFLSCHWGQGFASEAATASLKYAENTLKFKKVAAITSPLNLRSICMLETMGFQYKSEFSHPGSNEVLSLYQIRL